MSISAYVVHLRLPVTERARKRIGPALDAREAVVSRIYDDARIHADAADNGVHRTARLPAHKGDVVAPAVILEYRVVYTG